MANQKRTGQRAGAGQRGQARARGAGTRSATGSGATTGRTQAAQRGTATARADAATGRTDAAAERHGRTLTVTIPDRAADIAMLPVAAGRRVLTARRGGLPVYVGLGVLAAVDVIELPVAAAVGVGYAVLRRWGPLRPAHEAPDGTARSSSGGGEE